MQIDPVTEWQRIAEVYRGMYDDELINLAYDSQDLTDVARQALDLELKKRGLGDLSNARPLRAAPEPRRERRAALLGNQGGAPQLVIDYRTKQDTEAPLEYTWKTQLCECESMVQARLLREFLRRAGIESWIDGQNAGFRHKGLEVPSPKVLVGADQLDQARAIMANPIPREIFEESKIEEPEFEMPKCPHCGDKDPALEGVDRFNSWRCESCGYQWTDSEKGRTSDLEEEA
jgi:Putative prokaryotic signal transducing protein